MKNGKSIKERIAEKGKPGLLGKEKDTEEFDYPPKRPQDEICNNFEKNDFGV